MLLTDPPYGVSYTGGTKDAMTIENDDITGEELRKFLSAAFVAADKHMNQGASFYIWHADSEGSGFRNACLDIGWQIRQCLIWIKDSMVLGRQDYQWKHEPCLYGWKGGSGHQFLANRKQTTVQKSHARWKINPVKDGVNITIDGETYLISGQNLRVKRVDTTLLEFDRPIASRDHPTMKPVALFEYQIINSARKGQIVLDLFGGSGTTAIACERTGRQARLVELDPKYADVIRRRWAEYVYGEDCDWVAMTPEIQITKDGQ